METAITDFVVSINPVYCAAILNLLVFITTLTSETFVISSTLTVSIANLYSAVIIYCVQSSFEFDVKDLFFLYGPVLIVFQVAFYIDHVSSVLYPLAYGRLQKSGFLYFITLTWVALASGWNYLVMNDFITFRDELTTLATFFFAVISLLTLNWFMNTKTKLVRLWEPCECEC